MTTFEEVAVAAGNRPRTLYGDIRTDGQHRASSAGAKGKSVEVNLNRICDPCRTGKSNIVRQIDDFRTRIQCGQKIFLRVDPAISRAK